MNKRRDFLKNSGLLLGGLLLGNSKVFSRTGKAFFSTEPLISEITIFAFNYAPKDWMQCNGQILNINQYQALYSLLRTTYGGDGQTTFALPDLQGRAPMHFGNENILGERDGEVAHALTINEIPVHKHGGVMDVNQNIGNPGAGGINLTDEPVGNYLAENSSLKNRFSSAYDESMALVMPAGEFTSKVGTSQAHNNMQPYLCLNFCIATTGIFPSRN